MGVILFSYSFDVVEAKSTSMEPAIHDGDCLLVFKLGGALGKLFSRRLILQRHTVVVFTAPNRPATEMYVKRVEATSGDRVHIDSGSLVLNGVPAGDPHGFYATPVRKQQDSWPVGEDRARDVEIPYAKLFVLGDNRAGSLDSRAFGPVQESAVGGIVVVTFHL